MALKGDLGDLDIADLVQLHCQAGTRARLTVENNEEVIALYFDDGQVIHAEGKGLEGEEAVYELLTWETGEFEVEQGVSPESTSIAVPWSGLLMEGMRRLDEKRHQETLQSLEKESEEMAEQTRSERLASMLRNLVNNSADIKGAAVVSRDGLIMRAELPSQAEQVRVGAVAAAILSLSGRSVEQLKRGEFKQTLVQGTDGNIIIVAAGENALLVALTASDANMGMVFLEVGEGAEAVSNTLG
jgi:hypothetical protein